MVAYGFITLLSTFFALRPFLAARTDPPRQLDIISTAFVESLSYLLLTTLVAFAAYLSRMRTLYELTMAIFIVRLLCSATISTVFNLDLRSEKGLPRRQLAPIIIGFLGSLVVAVFAIFIPLYGAYANFIDSPCSKFYEGPLRLTQAMAVPYVIVAIVFAQSTRKNRLEKRLASTVGLNFLVLWVSIEFMLMWVTFALIILVRVRAKDVFGSSYDDNALGYGQIMATGFCLQTIAQLGMAVMGI